MKVLEHLGYEETFQDIYTLSRPVDSEVVRQVAFECFKAAAECSYQEKLLAAFLKGNPHLSWEQKCEAARCVLKCRENGFSEMEECFEAIWDDLRVMKSSTTATYNGSSPLGIKSFSHESLMSSHLPMNGDKSLEKCNHGSLDMSRHFDSQQSSTENLLTVHSDGSYRSSDRPKLTAATFQPQAKPWHGIGDELSAEIIREKKPSSGHSLIQQYEDEHSNSPKLTTLMGVKTRMNKSASSQDDKTGSTEKGKFKTLIEKVSKRESHSRDGHKMLQNVVRQFSNVGNKLTAINAKKRIGELLNAAENLRSAPNKRRTTTWYTDADDSVDAVSIKSEQGLGDHVVSNSRSYTSHGSLKLTKTAFVANQSKVVGYADGSLSLTCPRCHWSSVPCDGDYASENNVDQEHSSHYIPLAPPPLPVVNAKRVNRQSSLGEQDSNHHSINANSRQSAKSVARPLSKTEPKPPADALMDELVQKLALRRSRIEAGEVTFDSFGKPPVSLELDNTQSAVGALSLGQSSVLSSASNNNGIGENVDGAGAALVDTGCVLPECSSPVGAVSLSRASSRLNPLAGGLSAIAEDEELHNADGETANGSVQSGGPSTDSMCSLASGGTVLPARPQSGLGDANEGTMAMTELATAGDAMQRQCVHCSTDSDGAMCCACCSCGDAVGPSEGISGDGSGNSVVSCVACTPSAPLARVTGSSLTPTLVQ